MLRSAIIAGGVALLDEGRAADGAEVVIAGPAGSVVFAATTVELATGAEAILCGVHGLAGPGAMLFPLATCGLLVVEGGVLVVGVFAETGAVSKTCSTLTAGITGVAASIIGAIGCFELAPLLTAARVDSTLEDFLLAKAALS